MAFLVSLFITFIFSSVHAGKLTPVTRTNIALGTYVKIIIVTDKKDEPNARKIIDKSFKRIEELDRALLHLVWRFGQSEYRSRCVDRRPL